MTGTLLQISLQDLLWEAATFTALVLLVFFILLMRSWEDGYIRDYLDDREAGSTRGEGREADRLVVEEIKPDLEEIKGDVKETREVTYTLQDQQVAIREAIVMLHQNDEEVNERKLREQLQVEDLPSDILEETNHKYTDRSQDRFYRGGSKGPDNPHGDA